MQNNNNQGNNQWGNNNQDSNFYNDQTQMGQPTPPTNSLWGNHPPPQVSFQQGNYPPPMPGQFYNQPPVPAAQPRPYSKTILIILIVLYSIFWIFEFIAGAASSNAFATFLGRVGISLLWGILVSVLIMDWRGYTTIESLIKWQQMRRLRRFWMCCILIFFCMFVLGVYLTRKALAYSRSSHQALAAHWQIASPSRKPRIGVIVGTVVALLTFVIYSSSAMGSVSTTTVSTNTPATGTSPTSGVGSQPSVAPTPTLQPTPTQRPTPKTVTYPHFSGDGTFQVGKDIQPGTYRTREASSGCYYARLSGFSGTTDDILANANTNAPAIITIADSDKGFQSANCGTWTKDLSAITTSKTSFDDGIYIVGTDLTPGTYKSSGQSGCYYARLSGFGGTTDDILANANTDTPAIVTISATDKGFQSTNCGTWTIV